MKKILVVDDEASIAGILAELLEMEGYEVRVASTGEEALATLAQGCPDLVLSDVMMPGMDGLALCQEIGQNPRYQRIPVVFMSAMTKISSTSACHMVAFIPKPFEIDTVLHTVERVLAESHQA